MLRMRLRRAGARKQPRYRVVVAEARSPRDGAFIDILGYYDPLTEPSTVRINEERAREWIQKGAQPSEAVERILRRAGIELRPSAAAVTPSAEAVTPSAAAVTPSAAAVTPEAQDGSDSQ